MAPAVVGRECLRSCEVGVDEWVRWGGGAHHSAQPLVRDPFGWSAISLWHPTPPGRRHPSLLAHQGYGGVVFAQSDYSGSLTVSIDSCTITGNVAEQVSMRYSVKRGAVKPPVARQLTSWRLLSWEGSA